MIRVEGIVFGCIMAAGLTACAGHTSSSPNRPAIAQPLAFVSTRSDSVTVRYRGVAYTRGNEVDVVLREGIMPETGPFTGFFRGYSIALASGEPPFSLRVNVESNRLDEKKIHFADNGLADSLVFRIRGVNPDSVAGMWFVVQELRLWHRDDNPVVAPVAVARSTDVFRPHGTAPRP